MADYQSPHKWTLNEKAELYYCLNCGDACDSNWVRLNATAPSGDINWERVDTLIEARERQQSINIDCCIN